MTLAVFLIIAAWIAMLVRPPWRFGALALLIIIPFGLGG